MTTYTAINSNGSYGAYGGTWKVRITTSAPSVEALIPQYDRANSFYGKAHVETMQDGAKILVSYCTEVCKIDASGKVFFPWGEYSVTTMRHINEFLRQNGKNALGKAEYLKAVEEQRTK